MSDITYGITKTEYDCNGTQRLSYGIAAYADAEENRGACVVATVNDLSTDPSLVRQLVDRCNSGELSLLHMQEVIEDFLATH